MEDNSLCWCCLETSCPKLLWAQHQWMGNLEVYGDMLNECYILNLTPESSLSSRICELCISQLRNALSFRRQVEQCQRRMLQAYVAVSEATRTQSEENPLLCFKSEPHETTEMTTDDTSSVVIKMDVDKVEPMDDSIADEHYSDDYSADERVEEEKEVEEIEEKEQNEPKPVTKETEKRIIIIKAPNETRRRKKVRAKKPVALKSNIDTRTDQFVTRRWNIGQLLYNSTICPFKYSRRYYHCYYCNKQYPIFKDLRDHVDLCHRNLTLKFIYKSIYKPQNKIKADVSTLACKHCEFKCVVVKDLVTHLKEVHSVKFLSGERDPCDVIVACDFNVACKNRPRSKPKVCKIPEGEIMSRTDRYITVRWNIGNLLYNTNICPFKSHMGYFKCYHCPKVFVNFDELRSHFDEEHGTMPLKSIYKSLQKPKDKIKADISSINCKICSYSSTSLKDILSHLTDKHDVKFKLNALDPNDIILGYDLSEGKYRCVVCKKEFAFFKTLSQHMNEHTTNYVCDFCGRCFLFESRLTSHTLTHSDRTEAECNICGKVLSSQRILKHHLKYKHANVSYNCTVCKESFPSYHARMQHLVENHGRTPLNLTCKICSKNFVCLSTLNTHIRAVHMRKVREPKFECDECGKRFTTLGSLKNHLLAHTGKKFECEVCHKMYSRMKSLKEHLKIHKNDRRWSCKSCARTFVQKCSLKNHIKVHHPESTLEELLVYTKTVND